MEDISACSHFKQLAGQAIHIPLMLRINPAEQYAQRPFPLTSSKQDVHIASPTKISKFEITID